MPQNQIVMKDNLFVDNLRQSTIMRIFLYLVILFISALIGVTASTFFMFAGTNGMRIGQGISSIMTFVVPPIVYYFITRKERPLEALGFRKVERPWLLLIAAAVMFVSLPVTNQLTEWNENMSFGTFFTKIEDILKTMEEAASNATEQMLNVNTIGGLLLNLIIIALIPAIGEELTFRGVLQQALTRGIKNAHVAIILSAAIFSFIHFQFYGFLPRMFLGILLGYMFYTTSSIWTSILMHFLNNGSAVLVYWLNNRGLIDVDIDHFGASSSIWIVVASALITIGLIIWSWRKRGTQVA